jgi:hypothetical protein
MDALLTVSCFYSAQDWVVSPAECMSFQEGEMELALQLLANHNGELSPVRMSPRRCGSIHC